MTLFPDRPLPAASSWRTRAAATGPDVPAALTLAVEAAAESVGAPAGDVLSVLAGLGAGDLTAARVVEPHVDAVLILAEAGDTPRPGTYGVFAAEGPGLTLEATEQGGSWRLTGDKPWCSLAGVLDRALVTAHLPGGRRMFDVDLHAAGVVAAPTAGWVARGLAAVPSGPVRFDGVAAEPVGDVDWYLRRPGFAHGAVRVAACWYGATVALVQFLRDAVAAHPAPGDLRRYSLGTADVAAWSAGLALTAAGAAIDAGTGDQLLAARVRAVVAASAETVLTQVGHALGPAPLAFDEVHARRVVDLQLYLRQHHAERDLAALAGMVLDR